jgi:ABC-type branched-subunit amino acid transport system substrate-binding protein
MIPLIAETLRESYYPHCCAASAYYQCPSSTESNAANAPDAGAALCTGVCTVTGQGRVLISAGISSALDGPTDDQPWIRVAPSTLSIGESIAKAALAQAVTSMSIIRASDQFNATLADAFRQRFMLGGGSVVQDLELPSGQLSYVVQLTQLGDGPVFLAADPQTAARVANDLAALGKKISWFLSPTLRTDAFVQNVLPSAVAGAYGLSPRAVVADDFATAFKQYWSGDLPIESALFYYDAFALVALGYARALSDNAGAATPSGPQLAQGMLGVSLNAGSRVAWSELPAGVTAQAQGNAQYYSGLTGPVAYGPGGIREYGFTTAWTITDTGDIAVLSQ